MVVLFMETRSMRSRHVLPRVAGLAVVVLMVPTTGACDGEPPAPAAEPDVVVGTVPPSAPPARRGVTPSPAPLRGSEAWRLRHRADGQIEGYAAPVAGPPGTRVSLRVSTGEPSYHVEVYRIGAYRGGTGRRVWTSPRLLGERQAEPVMHPAETRTVVAPWHESLALDTSEFVPGVYLVKLVTRSGLQAAVPYVVTSPTVEGKVVVVAPVATWQAYNRWGGYSLYHGPEGDRRAWRVSFDRPYLGDGMGEVGFGIAPVAMAAERTRAPLAYLTDLDLHADPGALDGAEGYVSAGHDEYWTPEMRATVERARDHGTDLAFLGANTMYWRIRLEPSSLGPRRVVVGYRGDAFEDPERDPVRVTGRFRDAPAASSERGLVGMEYECFPVDADFRVASPRWWGFRGTGVRAGTAFPHLVGDEADRVYPGGGTPQPLQVLAHSPYTCGGVPTSAQATWYTARSGAGVFASGTLRWTCSLTPGCFGLPVPERTRTFVQRVTQNLVTGFALGRAGARHPAQDDMSAYALPRENQVPPS